MTILTITLAREPDDPGYRATASGHPKFDAAFAEYGQSPQEAIGYLVLSLSEMDLLGEPVVIDLNVGEVFNDQRLA